MSKIRIIKKYPNRRLYDTETSSYITLAEVKQLVLANVNFQVVDAKTNEDLTRNILLQIILDEEAQGAPIFSSELLANVIRFYGNTMQSMMGIYLEKSIHAFVDAQQKLQEQAKALYGDVPQFNADMWTQFFKNQAPQMPNMMNNYVEQSTNIFLQMQEQMRKQAFSFFSGFPFAPSEQKAEEDDTTQDPNRPNHKRS